MVENNINDEFPNFSLFCTNNEKINNLSFKNKKIILFVYPKSNTPTCTKQSLFFSENINNFKNENFTVYGLSNDDIETQKKFKNKYKLNYEIISDSNLNLIKKLNLWVEKKMYGKIYYGTERTTFIIVNNKINMIWRKVKIKNHIEEILDYIKK